MGGEAVAFCQNLQRLPRHCIYTGEMPWQINITVPNGKSPNAIFHAIEEEKIYTRNTDPDCALPW